MTEIHDAELVNPPPGQTAAIVGLIVRALDTRVADQLRHAREAMTWEGEEDAQIRAGAQLEARQCSAIAARLRGADPSHLEVALEWLGMAEPHLLPRTGKGAPTWRLPTDKDGDTDG